MPEGPELFMTSRFINAVCHGKYFSGCVRKSDVSKCPPIHWHAKLYQIVAFSRGKELKLTLTDIRTENVTKDVTDESGCSLSSECRDALNIVFTFGLTGKFSFDSVDDIPKHAHLKFYTADNDMVLSYVDCMRFGKWTPDGKWKSDRGPCVLQEYELFRKNVLSNLGCSAFNKPICEVLLNQKYFNGVGNYLRAEILYRCGIRPFDEARSVLEGLSEETKVKSEKPDILYLCHSLSLEVVNLTQSAEQNGYSLYDEESDKAFITWLKCYNNINMNHISDHNRRTVWFAGDSGPMVPRDGKQKHRKRPHKEVSKKTTFGAEEGTIESTGGKNGSLYFSSDQQFEQKMLKPRRKREKKLNSVCNEEFINTKMQEEVKITNNVQEDWIAKRTRSRNGI
ncbi:hypothetical protein LSH36_279g02070 [Paralvinella palmiformis]|uniref:Formamidopyrimidine-DNA glycosylase catalytic domain-containing protein n=1 Tax=Paralvinella palmiformis TaxID=53620 RepID=A0AAD9JIV4_9ANNE|nr:hypothetical protein LSH36_279g02070 [Paralvinella palmiformis]